jgi:3-methyl-2-oxobutanoate hydroxymethyltransferase
MKKIRISHLRAMKEKGERFAIVTAYDALTARFVEGAEVEAILIGDSLGNTSLGFSSTLPVTLDMMIHHAAAVSRGASLPLLICDMPFLTYKISPEQALANAGRLIQEGHAEAVKIEGGAEMAPIVERIVNAGIPVISHIGLMPQSIHAQGGFRVQGRDIEDADRLLADARALSDAGAFGVVLEAMPSSIARTITESIPIPTVGIGAGPHCDAQIIVLADVLGLSDRKVPKFVKQYAQIHEIATEGLRSFSRDIRDGKFPYPENTYGD